MEIVIWQTVLLNPWLTTSLGKTVVKATRNHYTIFLKNNHGNAPIIHTKEKKDVDSHDRLHSGRKIALGVGTNPDDWDVFGTRRIYLKIH